jgi:hypothetical protein
LITKEMEHHTTTGIRQTYCPRESLEEYIDDQMQHMRTTQKLVVA